MNTTPAPAPRSSRRVLGALGSALAVAVVGVGALPAATATAAGVRTSSITATPAPVHTPLADPSATAVTTGATTVRYRFTSDGGLVRL